MPLPAFTDADAPEPEREVLEVGVDSIDRPVVDPVSGQ
jgi:hypothetical protein